MDKSIGQKFEFKTVLLVLVILLALVILIGGLFGREPANELEVKDEVKQVELADTVSLQVDSASLTTVAEVMKAAANLQSHAASNAGSISQKAALAAITGDQGCVEEMRREFEKRRDVMVSRICAMKKISCPKPEGAFYVLCDTSGLKISSGTCANRLLDEAKVAVIPGEPFGDDSVIRLSFATGMNEIKKGLDRIEGWIKDNG